MNFERISVINVYLGTGLTKVRVGRLALKDRKILFEYSPEFIESGLELSPFKLTIETRGSVSKGYII